MPEIYGIRNGLNLDNLDVTTDDGINTFLTSSRIGGHESEFATLRGAGSVCRHAELPALPTYRRHA